MQKKQESEEKEAQKEQEIEGGKEKNTEGDEENEKKKKENQKDKDLNEAKKENKEELHRKMDEAFESIKTQPQRLKGKRTMDEYLKVWSKTVEHTMLKHMQIDEEIAKNMRGRGQVNLKKVTPHKEAG